MRGKHVLFLSSWYPSRIHPFNGDFIQRHATAASLLNEITVLHAAKDENLSQIFETEIRNSGIKEVIVYYKTSSFRPWNYIRRLMALNAGLKHVGNFDIVHLNVTYPIGVYALYLKIFKKKKYVITEHWTGFREELFQKVNIIERALIKLILKKASKLLPVSKDLGNNMIKVSPLSEIEVIPNVVFTDIFNPPKRSGNSIIKFLHLSSLKYEHKNIQGMLDVVKVLADEGLEFEFHIGGTGSLETIQEFIQRNSLNNIIFTFGALNYDKVAQKMQQYDAFVLFSNYENQPCVQAESFACGLAFIGTNVGGIKEFFPKDFGFLIQKGNQEELYKAMKAVIQRNEFAPKEKMFTYVTENFSSEVIAKRFDKVYKDILNG